MLFNTFEYLFFFCIVFLLFVSTNNKNTLKLRNLFLLTASYYFYAQLHSWFVILLIYTTVVNYFCGSWIARDQQQGKSGKRFVTTAIVLSIAQLVFFKYAYLANPTILLPVGLSFFTFQALSYSIDIYRKKIEPEKNVVDIALFIAFFPTLLSGPIERARNLIPQLKEKTSVSWDNFKGGAGLFIWGVFKKVVIADRLAEYVNAVYFSPESHSGSTLALAALFYSFQIYCDFSGYADMAIGSGRVMGFKIMQNFNFPYCVNTFKEFWRRWHISLTSWFTEYVYISLGGNRVSQARWILNISLVFLLSGIWHGATWSFVLWGAMHAVFYLVERFWGPKRPNILYHLLVFVMITFAWIFFRIENSVEAWHVVTRICSDIISPVYWGSSTFSTLLTMLLLGIFMLREYLMYRNILPQKSAWEYLFLLLAIGLFGVSSDQFVYFQF
ncbi:MBOAT family O-acyltransferase [Barnesiella sp. An22]|uniref:MBOAT family O-acyltransferase n=1 Tax=Barnesiella sp. An22 TaxID=1965590 RepID=UPI000B369B3C|nr:MBOAT family O-acyltransferase [Barnesiella sp. An22]OUO99743.1 membrane-bound O-acyltransferase family protein [Barnesiella sp. An22]